MAYNKQRFYKRLRPVAGGCLKWVGPAQFWDGSRPVAPARYAWELEHGPAPAGFDVVRTCGTPNCCNPAHLKLAPHGKKAKAPCVHYWVCEPQGHATSRAVCKWCGAVCTLYNYIEIPVANTLVLRR
jgi:hypothetical protein